MKDISRRQFMKVAGAGALAAGVAAACKPGDGASGPGAVSVSDGMPLRTNPNTGDKVSLLGYGCMRWPMIKDAEGKDVIDQAKVDELVDYAIAHGVNYFDSAPVYLQGQSEQATAKALSRYPRDSYYIATKLSNHRGFEPTYDEGVAMYRRSLEYYNTDHIDYYLMHNLGGEKAFNERFKNNGLLDFLLRERQEGRIRNLGFSYHGQQPGFDEMMALHDKYHWDFVQIQMNYVDWNRASSRNLPAKYAYDQLYSRGIPVVIMEPLLGGRLSDVPKVVAERFKEREPQASVASWAFRFCGTMPGVMCALSGMTYMEHLQDNISTFEHFKPLTDEELVFLEEMAGLINDYPLVPCTNCQYCMPCPYGIDIPGVFKHYNGCVSEGEIAQSTEQKDFRKLKKKYLASYDKAIASVRQADHCISCGQCMPHCPQSIQIPRELRRIDAYVESLKQETL